MTRAVFNNAMITYYKTKVNEYHIFCPHAFALRFVRVVCFRYAPQVVRQKRTAEAGRARAYKEGRAPYEAKRSGAP